jgi:hypothetical protein
VSQTTASLARALRRLTLGHGPLLRWSDRVELLSRLAALVVGLLSLPIALTLATVAGTDLSAVAREEAASRQQETALLLATVPSAATVRSEYVMVRTEAVWSAPDGSTVHGEVLAPPGSSAGTTVPIWVDVAGRPADRPLDRADVVSHALLVGVFSFLSLSLAATGGHLLVCHLLWRHRSRRWAEGWAAVEPVWAGRADR